MDITRLRQAKENLGNIISLAQEQNSFFLYQQGEEMFFIKNDWRSVLEALVTASLSFNQAVYMVSPSDKNAKRVTGSSPLIYKLLFLLRKDYFLSVLMDD